MAHPLSRRIALSLLFLLPLSGQGIPKNDHDPGHPGIDRRIKAVHSENLPKVGPCFGECSFLGTRKSRKGADLSGDGQTDLLWLDPESGQVVVTQPNDSQPQSSLLHTATKEERVVALADFTGDGISDLLWENPSTGAFSLQRVSQLSGQSPEVLHTESNPAWMFQAAADFTGDGQADLLWRNSSTGEIYLMPQGNGVVEPGTLVASAPDIAWKIVGTADFNGDGKADIFWRNTRTGFTRLMIQDGQKVTAQIETSQTSNATWHLAALGDFDGDQQADLLWMHKTSGQLYVMFTQSGKVKGGSFLLTPESGWDLAATGDYDGDGRTDLMLRNTHNGAIQKLLVNGYKIKEKTPINIHLDHTWTLYGDGLAAINKRAQDADFNGDGLSDLMVWNRESDSADILLSRKYQQPALHTLNIEGITTTSRLIGSIDLNGDGKADGLWQNPDGELRGVLLDGPQILGTAPLTMLECTDIQFIGSGDFNGDGKSDLLVWNAETDKLHLLLGQGLQPMTKLPVDSILEVGTRTIDTNTAGRGIEIEAGYDKDPLWQPMMVGDFDGDGQSDVLFQHAITGALRAVFLNGTSVKSGQILLEGESGHHHLITIAADFNQDGLTDLLRRDEQTGIAHCLTWTKNFQAVKHPTRINLDVSWKPFAAGDYNGDGKMDLAVRSRTVGDVKLLPFFNFQSTGGEIRLPEGLPLNHIKGGHSFPVANVCIQSFIASPSVIAPGQSSEITAIFVGGKNATLSPGDIPVQSGVPIKVSPSQDTTYSLDVENEDGNAWAHYLLPLSVKGPSVDRWVIVQPEPFTVGDSAEICFIFYGSKAVLMPGSIPIESGIKFNLSPVVTTTYTIIISDDFGNDYSESFEIKVEPKAKIISFQATPNVLTLGQSFELKAEFTGGTGMLIPGDIPIISGVPVRVTPSESVMTWYVLTVGSGSAQASASTEVTVFDPPAISSFTAEPANITVGQSTELKAVFTGGTGVIVPGNIPIKSGVPLSIRPSEATTIYYALTVTNPTGEKNVKTTMVSISTKTAPSSILVSPMNIPRQEHTATLLDNGKVLIVGGIDGDFSTTSTSELYDPASGKFTLTGKLSTSRYDHSATLLRDGRVLVVGGYSYDAKTYLDSAEIYDPKIGEWTQVQNMSIARKGQNSALLPNGRVLVVGGTFKDESSSAEIFDPVTGTWESTTPMSMSRLGPGMIALDDGKVFVVGGYGSQESIKTGEVYDPETSTWTLIDGMIGSHFASTIAIKLFDGRILIVGGSTICDIFDPSLSLFKSNCSSQIDHTPATAARLSDGRVVVIGNAFDKNGIEVFDPLSGKFDALGETLIPRYEHTITMLPDGKILICGGGTTGGSTNTVELYDPYGTNQ